MKKIKLQEVKFVSEQILTRDQLKTVFAGSASIISSTGGDGSAPCKVEYTCAGGNSESYAIIDKYCGDAFQKANNHCNSLSAGGSVNPHEGHPHP